MPPYWTHFQFLVGALLRLQLSLTKGKLHHALWLTDCCSISMSGNSFQPNFFLQWQLAFTELLPQEPKTYI